MFIDNTHPHMTGLVKLRINAQYENEFILSSNISILQSCIQECRGIA